MDSICTKSRVGRMESRQAMPTIEVKEPEHEDCLKSKKNPNCKRSKVNRKLPDLAVLRTSITNPKWTGSNTDEANSKRATPAAGKKEAVRQWVCGNVEKSKCKESRTNKLKPKQTKLCTDGKRPKCVRSSTGVVKSRQTRPKANKNKLGLAMFFTKTEEPRCRKSSMDAAKPGCAWDLTERDDPDLK